MKAFFTLIILTLLIQLVLGEWTSKKDTNIEILPNHSTYVDFTTEPSIIGWQVQCTSYCNIYLVDLENLELIQSGKIVTYYYGVKRELTSSFEYNNNEIIKKKLYLIVVNPSTDKKIFASFVRREFKPYFGQDSYVFIGIGLFLLALGIMVILSLFCFLGIRFVQSRKKEKTPHQYLPQDEPIDF
eukprot:gene7178-11490_t